MCNILPENADRYLFAEDIVNHVLQRLEVDYQYHSGIANHRARICNAFNPELRTVVDYCCSSHRGDIDTEFEVILRKVAIGGETFCKYVADLRSFVSQYPIPERLMNFCVKISMMAEKFYRNGYLNAPFAAIQFIINLLNEVQMQEADWAAFNDLARSWAQYFMDMNENNLTPDRTTDSDRGNSDASNSPDHEMGGGEDQNNYPGELSDDGMHVDAAESPSEEAVSSSSDSERIEKPCDAEAGIIAKSSVSTSDFSYVEKHSEDSSHSYEDTSSDEDSKRNKQNKKPSCSNPKECDSGTVTCEKDLNTVNYKDPSGVLLNEKH